MAQTRKARSLYSWPPAEADGYAVPCIHRSDREDDSVRRVGADDGWELRRCGVVGRFEMAGYECGAEALFQLSLIYGYGVAVAHTIIVGVSII